MLTNLVNATYIAAGLMFILALAGLSKHETAKKGNAFGILGMVLALVATNYAIAQPVDGRGFDWTSAALLYGAIAIGAVIGTWKARRVEMTGMPELIALLHSFVGAAAVLVGFNVHLSATHTDVLHAVEVVLGIFIGAVTLTGSLVAWGKLNGPDRLETADAARQELDQPGHARRRRRPRLVVRRDAVAGPAAAGDPGLPGPGLPPGGGHRRRRHAGGGLDAELLLRLGGGLQRIHAGPDHPHHHGRPGRSLRRDPVLHHVPGHEPFLRLRDPRWFR